LGRINRRATRFNGASATAGMGVDFHTDRAAAVVVDLDAVAAVAAAVVVRVMRSSAVNATEGTRADFHTRPAEAAEAAVEAGTAAEATDLAANATRSKRDDAIAAIRADFRINHVLAN